MNNTQNKNGFIYKIESPTGRVYIGRTTDFKRRVRRHMCSINSKKEKSPRRLFNSFAMHGPKSHVFSVIEECEIALLSDREEYWISRYNATGPKGMNLSAGRGSSGVSVSSLNKKLTSRLKSIKVYQYGLDGKYIKCWSSVTKASNETGTNITSIGQCCSGVRLSSGGFLWSREKHSRISVPNGLRVSRPVLLFKKDGGTFRGNDKFIRFSTPSECAEFGVIYQNLLRCLYGDRMSVGKYIAIYEDEYNGQDMTYSPMPRPSVTKKSRVIVKMDMDGNDIQEYQSLALAARSVGMGGSDIKLCCEGKRKRCGRNKWRYGN